MTDNVTAAARGAAAVLTAALPQDIRTTIIAYGSAAGAPAALVVGAAEACTLVHRLELAGGL